MPRGIDIQNRGTSELVGAQGPVLRLKNDEGQEALALDAPIAFAIEGKTFTKDQTDGKKGYIVVTLPDGSQGKIFVY